MNKTLTEYITEATSSNSDVELVVAAKEAFSNFKIPKNMFENNEIYTIYPSYNLKNNFIRFDNPWSLIFWNQNMLGQMSDGIWENARKFDRIWEYYYKLTPVFDSHALEYKWVPGINPNPVSASKYAIPERDMIKFGKIYQMNDKDLLPFLFNWKVNDKDITIEGVRTLDNAKKNASKFNIDYETYLAVLGCPELPEKECLKIIKCAHKDMQSPMSAPKGIKK